MDTTLITQLEIVRKLTNTLLQKQNNLIDFEIIERDFSGLLVIKILERNVPFPPRWPNPAIFYSPGIRKVTWHAQENPPYYLISGTVEAVLQVTRLRLIRKTQKVIEQLVNHIVSQDNDMRWEFTAFHRQKAKYNATEIN